MRKPLFPIFLFAAALLFSCKTFYQPSSLQYKDYRISSGAQANSDIVSLLKPYSDSVNRNMNEVVAVAGMAFEKKQPEGTLGNLLTDAMLAKAKENYNTHVDAAFINAGGIRLNSLAAGNISKGKVYEVSPFDNVLVLLKVNGKILQQMLDVAASKGGWPCAGASYQLKDKKAVNIKIAGNPVAENGEYVIALVDYIANGGDNCDMLRTIPQTNNGGLFRDAVIAYLSDQHKQGKKIFAQLENRVSNAE
jgi:2',3'-cyclic-nucleotide 2'-phosphodiesterase (5'-nucleotidase family)